MNRKTFCSVLLLLLPLLTLCGQEAYMGQIQITRRSFSLSGNQLWMSTMKVCKCLRMNRLR